MPRILNLDQALRDVISLFRDGGDEAVIPYLNRFTKPQQAAIYGEVKKFREKTLGRAKTALPKTPVDLAVACAPERFEHATHIDFLGKRLAHTYTTGGNLLVTMPPRHTKTSTAVQWFSFWTLAHNPTAQIIYASYEADYAAEWGAKTRALVMEYGKEYGLQLDPKQSARDNWRLTAGGGMTTAGVGGALTGRGASVLLCFPAETHIATEDGSMDIQTLCRLEYPPRVLSYDFASKRTVYRRIKATRRVWADNLVRVTTAQGKSLRCTPDHRIYTSEGFREAQLLGRGTKLLARVVKDKQDLPTLCGTDWKGESRGPLLGLLPESPESASRTSLRELPQPSYSLPLRVREGAPERQEARLLFGGLQTRVGEAYDAASEFLRSLWGSLQGSQQVLHAALSGSLTAQARSDLQALRTSFQVSQFPEAVLHPSLRRPGTFYSDEGDGKLALQGWNELLEVVSGDATADLGTRSEQVRRVWGQAEEADDPSSGREAREQHSGESGDALRELPHGSPQVEEDTVSLVESIRDGGDFVYDLEVEGAHNFFAENILVHNCDDLVKNEIEATSETTRERIDAWVQTVALTRLEAGSCCVFIGTLWHEDDILSRLIKRSNGGEGRLFEIIRLPALAEKDDVLGRDEGDALWPERFPAAALTQIKRSMSSYHWTALYQCRPSPEGGGKIRDAWWCYHTPESLPPDFDQMVQSWDLSLKVGKGRDPVAGQVWGRKGADFYLLAEAHGELDLPRVIAQCKKWAIAYPRAKTKLIEDKAAGPALIQMLRHEAVGGVIPVNPKASKEARVEAILPLIEGRNVFLPKNSDGTLPAWVDEFIGECRSFPQGKHDDRVDAMTQALTRLMPGGWSSVEKGHNAANALNQPHLSPKEQMKKLFWQGQKEDIKAYEESESGIAMGASDPYFGEW